MKREVKKNAKILINRAQGDFLFNPDEDQEPRYLQAFLLQASVIEGLLRESCNSYNRKNKVTGLSAPKMFHQAAREARASGSISKGQFEKIEAYIDFRNKVVHTILEKNSRADLENNTNKHYQIGSEIIAFLLK